MNIVIDTNIFISALIKEGLTRDLITNSYHIFLFPEFELQEIENHKDEILKKSKLSRKDFYTLLFNLLKYVRIIRTERIIDYREEAYDIMGNIDKDDVQFIATALAFQCPIWSDDKHFQQQKIVKVLTTKDMLKIN